MTARRRRIQRPARKTRETFAVIQDRLRELHEHDYTQQQRAIAEVTFRHALRDLRRDMDSMGRARGKIGRLRWALRVLFQPRVRDRYGGGFKQVKIWALGALRSLRDILDDYTR